MPDLYTLALSALVILEPFLVLLVAPRLTKRQVQPLFKAEIAPVIRVMLDEALAKQAAPPSLTQLRDAVLDAMKPAPPTPEQIAKMEEARTAQQAAFMQAIAAAIQPVLRSEVEAAFQQMPDPGNPSPEDGARAMAYRRVQKGYDYAANEEQFRLALEKNGALLEVDVACDTGLLPPKTYKAYASRGAEGAVALAKKAQALGIKLNAPVGHNGATHVDL